MKAVNVDEMARLYESGLSMQDVARATGVAVGTVYNRLKPLGISRPKSMSFLGRHHSPEARARMGAAHKGHHLSEETRKKISEAHKLHGIGHEKERTDGYIAVYYPSHPDATEDGYIMKHRLVMEEHIGRPIMEDEVVHHINHDRKDNRIENLQLMSFKEHAALHMKERHAERRALLLTL